MKLATIPTERLASWLDSLGHVKRPPEIEFHVFAQGYELRCGSATPLRLLDIEERNS